MKLRASDLEISHVKGSGPGGQNRNKRMSGVRIRHTPTNITVTATERRSQEQNLQAAMARLEEKVTAFFYRPAPRFDTKPTKASKVRRVEKKGKHSQKKRMRKNVDWSD